MSKGHKAMLALLDHKGSQAHKALQVQLEQHLQWWDQLVHKAYKAYKVK
jgi:hypothetical protein